MQSNFTLIYVNSLCLQHCSNLLLVLINCIAFIKLIRTTFFTRKQLDKRPDESSDVTIDRKTEISGMINDAYEMEIMPDGPTAEIKSSRIGRLTASIFGLTDNGNKAEQIKQQIDEEQSRLDAFESLNQSSKAKIILNANLILITSIGVLLFVVFSLPDELSVWT